MKLLGTFTYLLWLIALVACVAAPTRLNAAEATREQIQAAYLYHFLQFVDWPANAPAGSATYSVCVLGDERLARVLEASVEGKSIAGRPVTAHQLTDVREARTCHLLFLTGRRQTVESELKDLKTGPILTASDVPGLQKDGTVVTFLFNGNHMQFDINVENAKRRGISISSRLLQLARRPK